MRLIQICTYKSQRDAKPVSALGGDDGGHDVYINPELDDYIGKKLHALGIKDSEVCGISVSPHQVNERDRGSLDIWVMVRGWPDLDKHIRVPKMEFEPE